MKDNHKEDIYQYSNETNAGLLGREVFGVLHGQQIAYHADIGKAERSHPVGKDDAVYDTEHDHKGGNDQSGEGPPRCDKDQQEQYIDYV